MKNPGVYFIYVPPDYKSQGLDDISPFRSHVWTPGENLSEIFDIFEQFLLSIGYQQEGIRDMIVDRADSIVHVREMQKRGEI